MPRFADIARGTRATKTISLPLPGVEQPIAVLVRPLNGLELGRTVAQARAYAIAEIEKARPQGDTRPIPEPKEGDRLFDLGSMVATLLLACLDPASPPGASTPGVPFFASADEILSELDVERIVLLYEEQQLFQDECAPRPARMSGEAFIALVVGESALEEDAAEGPFSRLRRTLQGISFRTLARLYVTSQWPRSPGTSTAAAVASP
jgi:hypothetical protein